MMLRGCLLLRGGCLILVCILPCSGLAGAHDGVVSSGNSNASAALANIAPGDANAGKVLYEAKCGGCHSVDANRIGPLHRNVIGRVPGTAAGFDSSPALKKLKGVWTAKRIDMWLQDPQKVAPGTRMYLSVPDPTQRFDIISYLLSISAPSNSELKARHNSSNKHR